MYIRRLGGYLVGRAEAGVGPNTQAHTRCVWCVRVCSHKYERMRSDCDRNSMSRLDPTCCFQAGSAAEVRGFLQVLFKARLDKGPRVQAPRLQVQTWCTTIYSRIYPK